jgi:glycosyltransferase involved in cell wall biosynthesis
VNRFITAKRPASRIVVVRGGVDVSASERYLNSGHVIPVNQRKYDVCFIGRLHYQKGVLELVTIWKHVLAKRSNAKLVIIGDGPLESKLKLQIAQTGIEKSIDMVGFKDGEEKFNIFKQSKVIVHPATYDSGGMAAAEGMAWRLPGVSFDLEALKTYYPAGMLKTKKGELRQFADNILKLLNDSVLYEKLANEAHCLILREWVWTERAQLIYGMIFDNFKSKEAS